MLQIETVPDVAHCTKYCVMPLRTSWTKVMIVLGCTCWPVFVHRLSRCCISSSHTHPWSNVDGATLGCVKISFGMVTSLMSWGMMSCFITYHTISSAVQYPCLMHDSAMVFGIASSNSVRSTLSTAFCASGIFFLSPRIYAGSRLARWEGVLWSHWSCLLRAQSKISVSQYRCASPVHVATANVHLSYRDSSSCLISNMLHAL